MQIPGMLLSRKRGMQAGDRAARMRPQAVLRSFACRELWGFTGGFSNYTWGCSSEMWLHSPRSQLPLCRDHRSLVLLQWGSRSCILLQGGQCDRAIQGASLLGMPPFARSLPVTCSLSLMFFWLCYLYQFPETGRRLPVKHMLPTDSF